MGLQKMGTHRRTELGYEGWLQMEMEEESEDPGSTLGVSTEFQEAMSAERAACEE